jgi:Tol biopolymer transport system component
VWSPDGKQIVFNSARDGPPNLYMKAASGTGNEERLTQSSSTVQTPFDWSRDGRYILYSQPAEASLATDLWILPMTGERKPVPFLQTPFNETQGQFSPDGRWVAYVSNESNRNEIYVRNFSGAPAKFQISNNGGAFPHWRGDGKELYYLSADGKMMATIIKATAEVFERETPKVLFDAPWLSGGPLGTYRYDVTRDGQRFLIIAQRQGDRTQPLTLIMNWQAGLKK